MREQTGALGKACRERGDRFRGRLGTATRQTVPCCSSAACADPAA